MIICQSHLNMVWFSQIAFLLKNQMHQEDGILLTGERKVDNIRAWYSSGSGAGVHMCGIHTEGTRHPRRGLERR